MSSFKTVFLTVFISHELVIFAEKLKIIENNTGLPAKDNKTSETTVHKLHCLVSIPLC